MNRLIVVRHGESKGNKLGLLRGFTDDNLTEKGEYQALKAGKIIKGKIGKIDHFYCSPLKRTMTTAEKINSTLRKEIKLDKRIKEINLGIIENKSFLEPEEEFKDYIDKFSKGCLTFEVPNGESYIDFYQRVTDYINYLDMNYYKKDILVVTHGIVIKAMTVVVNDLPKKDFESIPYVNNCSINIMHTSKDSNEYYELSEEVI